MTQRMDENIGSLSEQLLGLISTTSDAQLDANVKMFKETLSSLKTTDVGIDAELIFRTSLDTLFLQGQESGRPSCSFGTCSNQSRIVELLNFAIELGKICEQLSFNIPKIPFILIEDLLQCQTLVNAQLIWDIVESKVDTLTLPVLFNRGKFIILRTCNALLKRLSRSCHTEFCGRVLMFLASVYPLSEKSAVNLTGKVNIGNVTHFEDEENFLLASGSGSGKDGGAGRESEMDESSDKQGSGAMEVVDLTDTTSGSGGGDAHVDYALYKAFWEIQGFLASDPKAMDQKNKWPELMKSADMLLTTFEADSSHASELKQARRRREHEKKEAMACASGDNQEQVQKTNGAKDPRRDYRGCKYLTSSQLFLLELQDPSIRQQLAIQLLITLHYRLKNMPPPPTKSTVASTAAAASHREQLQALETRLYKLLQNTPSSSADDLLLTLRSIFSSSTLSGGGLSREDGWLQWKQDHCPSFEKEAISRVDLKKSGERKRKRSENKGRSSDTAKRGSYYFEHEWGIMQEAAQALTKQVPSLETHIEDFVDAEDPEAGIEDEYHPKHDTVYCWRARRLIAGAKLSAFEDMAEGNVAKGLKLMGMIPEPPPQQEKQEDVDEDEEETPQETGSCHEMEEEDKQVAAS